MDDTEVKTRVVIEYDDLKTKHTQLAAFTASVLYDKLGDVQKALLAIQLKTMESYMSILGQRLKYWGR